MFWKTQKKRTNFSLKLVRLVVVALYVFLKCIQPKIQSAIFLFIVAAQKLQEESIVKEKSAAEGECEIPNTKLEVLYEKKDVRTMIGS